VIDAIAPRDLTSGGNMNVRFSIVLLVITAACSGGSKPAPAPPPAADRKLARLLSLAVAEGKWGEPGYYRIAAVLDPDVTTASHAFDRAAALLGH
jgi:hypothetical protein